MKWSRRSRNRRPSAESIPPPPAPVGRAATARRINFHNLVAVRIAFVVAPVAFLLSGIPALNLVLWIAAGFLAVFFHRRRTGVLLNVRAGVRLGWITGVLMFAITTVIFTLTVVPMAANGGIAALFRQQLKNPTDPNVQEALRMLETAPGLGRHSAGDALYAVRFHHLAEHGRRRAGLQVRRPESLGADVPPLATAAASASTRAAGGAASTASPPPRRRR